MSAHESMLVYRGLRYMRLSMLLIAISITAYLIHDPLPRPYGGSWLGYTLGGISALLVLWLMWFGVKKRSYGKGGMTKAWLSAHIYLGAALVVTTTLHAGFQFSWNLHTFTYILCMATIISGIFGVYTYARYPTLITANRRGDAFDDMLRRMTELDEEARLLTQGMPDRVTRVVNEAAEKTVIGGSALAQLRANTKNSPARKAFQQMKDLAGVATTEEAGKFAALVTIMGQKAELVDRVAKDIRFKAIMELWLFFHVPLAFGLLAALIAHVFVVFYMT